MLCTDINGTDPCGGGASRYGEGRFPGEGFSAKHSKDALNHFKLELVKLKQ